jgi:tetratricopeptide (TPR) repeat protein
LSELEKAYRQEVERIKTSAYFHDDSIWIIVAAVASAGLLLSLGFGWTQGRAIQQLNATLQNLRGSLHRLESDMAERAEPEPVAETKSPPHPPAKAAIDSETPPMVLLAPASNAVPAEPLMAKPEPQAPVSRNGAGSPGQPHSTAPMPTMDNTTRLELLLGKGQTLTLLGQKQSALECYHEALILAPAHPDVLVKKGKLLEQLERFDQALECYDRAIAAESTNATAYLLKAGLLNRLDRYAEALECYDLALRSRHQSLPG